MSIRIFPPKRQSLSTERLFDLLSSARRRFVLTHLYRADGPVALRDLADELAAREADKRVDDLTSQERKNAYVALAQTHIPRLMESGIVTQDLDRKTVALTGPGRDLGAYLVGEEHRSRWQLAYLAVATVGVALFLAVRLGLPPLAGLPMQTATLFVVVAFGVAAVAHALYKELSRPRLPLELLPAS